MIIGFVCCQCRKFMASQSIYCIHPLGTWEEVPYWMPFTHFHPTIYTFPVTLTALFIYNTDCRGSWCALHVYFYSRKNNTRMLSFRNSPKVAEMACSWPPFPANCLLEWSKLGVNPNLTKDSNPFQTAFSVSSLTLSDERAFTLPTRFSCHTSSRRSLQAKTE